jgi:hypothetical protein
VEADDLCNEWRTQGPWIARIHIAAIVIADIISADIDGMHGGGETQREKRKGNARQHHR